jgi:small multidrug resistance family-3 protein
MFSYDSELKATTRRITMAISIVLFIAAGLAEIGGGYLVWLWLKESKPLGYGIVGSIILVAYGIIPTLQTFPNFGRVYAAYGVFSLRWPFFGDG